MIRSILYPIKLQSNVSFDIKRKMLEDNNIEVISFSEGLRNLKDVDIINFNFFEIIHSNLLLVCMAKYIVKRIIVHLMKLFNVKIIYTIHNKQGHNSKYPKLDLSLMKFLLDKSDAIVVLCDETRTYIKDLFGLKYYKKVESKIVKIPLVTYEGAYPPSNINLRERWNVKQTDMVVLFLGGISKYKNIEYIIRYGNEVRTNNVKFVIAGNGKREYIEKLKNKLNQNGKNNIVFSPSYVQDDEVYAYLKACDLMLIPLNQKSSLNSGSCELAFSHHRNVVCSNIGTIKELPAGLAYEYSYFEEEMHYEAMKKALDKAIEEFENDRSLFIEKQEKLYQFSKLNNSIENISKKYSELYMRMCKNT